MRRLTISLLTLLFIVSCQKNDSRIETTENGDLKDVHRTCASQEALKIQLAADPTLAARLQSIEDFTKRKIASGEALRVNANNEIKIPVVVHVLYNTPEENISDAQIQSQIDVLNEA